MKEAFLVAAPLSTRRAHPIHSLQRTRPNRRPQVRAVLTVPEGLRDLFNTSGTRRFASPSPAVVQSAWERHRSRLRYLRHVLGFPTSKLGRRLLPLSLLPVAECLALRIFELLSGTTPHVPSAPIALTSGIVGLLLAFRTNASLARYYEARGAWAAIGTRCIDAARISMEYISGNSPSRAAQITKYLAAFPHVVRTHLEAASDKVLTDRVGTLLTKSELALVLAAHNRPAAVLQLCTHAGGEGAHMDEHVRVKLDGCFSGLLDSYNSVLQKLWRTPIPLSYTRHTSRACLMWCAYVPLTLYSEMGCIESAVSSAFITFLLLGIDDVSVTVEDPSRLLPLDEIVSMIERDVLSLCDNAEAIGVIVGTPLPHELSSHHEHKR